MGNPLLLPWLSHVISPTFRRSVLVLRYSWTALIYIAGTTRRVSTHLIMDYYAVCPTAFPWQYIHTFGTRQTRRLETLLYRSWGKTCRNTSRFLLHQLRCFLDSYWPLKNICTIVPLESFSTSLRPIHIRLYIRSHWWLYRNAWRTFGLHNRMGTEEPQPR